MRATVATVFLFLSLGAAAQEDSLRRVLNALPEDTSRLPVLTDLIRQTVFSSPDAAMAYARAYTAIAVAAGGAFHIGKGENFQGMSYAVQSDYDSAMVHYTRALAHFERAGNAWYTAMLHNNIGGVLIEQDRLDKALERFQRARAGFTAAGDSIWTVNVLNNLGNIYYESGRYDSSAAIYQRAAQALDAMGDSVHAASAWLNLGNARSSIGDTVAALADFDAVLARTDRGQSDDTRAMAFLGKGRVLMALHRAGEARAALDSGLALARVVGITQQVSRAHEDLAKWFESQGQLDSALRHQRLFSQWRDSVFSAEQSARIAGLQAKYDSEKKDALIARNQAKLERRSLTIKAIAAGAFLLLVAGLFAFRAYRVRRRSEAALARKNAVIGEQLAEKELLVREIHHRVKNNLQTVSSLLSIQGRGITDEKAKEAVNDSRLRLKSMGLIHQDLYREGDLTGVRMKDYVAKLASGLVNSFAMGDRVQLVVQVDDIALDVDTAVPIGLILNELVTNALKYAWPWGGTGALTVTLRQDADALEVRVEDDGVGMTGMHEDGRPAGFGLTAVRNAADHALPSICIHPQAGSVVYGSTSEKSSVQV